MPGSTLFRLSGISLIGDGLATVLFLADGLIALAIFLMVAATAPNEAPRGRAAPMARQGT